MKKFFIIFMVALLVIILGVFIVNKISDNATSVKSVDNSTE